MELSDYVGALRKRWLVIVVLAVLGAGAGFALARSSTPEYRSTSKVFVSLTRGETVSELVQGATYAQNLVESYVQVATMPAVLDPVIDELDLGVSARALAGRVTATSPLNTVIIEITAVDTEPGRAAQIANAVAEQLAATVTTISPTAEDGGETVQMSVLAEAQVPGAPFQPRTPLLMVTGGAAGVALGVLVALLTTLLDTRVRSAKDFPRVPERAVLGSIPFDRASSRRSAPTMVSQPHGINAEAYRRVQTNLQFLAAASTLRSIVLTSSVSGEGKSTTAINLALAVAEKRERVLLVDADLRRPSVARYCGLEGAAGLTTILIGSATLADVVQPWGAAGLDVLTSGGQPPNPGQLIDSAAMEAFLAEAVASYDLVIFDAPPLLPVSDAAVLARLTDGAVVVAGCRTVHRGQLVDALGGLDAIGATCLGLVANAVPTSESEQLYYAADAPLRPSRAGRRSRATQDRETTARGAVAPGVTAGVEVGRGKSTEAPSDGPADDSNAMVTEPEGPAEVTGASSTEATTEVSVPDALSDAPDASSDTSVGGAHRQAGPVDGGT